MLLLLFWATASCPALLYLIKNLCVSPFSGFQHQMHNRPYTSRASASRGSSRTSTYRREEQKAVISGTFDFQCDNPYCKASCNGRPDMFHHEESIRAWKQPCLFDLCEYKTGDVDNMKEHMKSLHGVPSKFNSWIFAASWMTNQYSGPNLQAYKISGSQYYQTCATQGGDTSFTHMDIDFLAELGELDKPTQAELSYDTTYTTHSLSEDLDDSEDSMFPYPNASTYLYGIGHWLEDDSITGSTWTAWQGSNLLLQHTFTLSSASVKKKPHVEEAMNRFQTSFYGVKAPKYHTVHK